MELIANNPYREAGILSNASQKELTKQKGKITAYLKVGKSVDSDLDFNFLQKIIRTEESTKTVFSKIEQSKDRVFHGLFWFLGANSFDTIALGYLKEGDISKAVAIWEKVTYGKQISDLNFSNFSNLGTLKLLGTTELEIQEGLEAKIKLIESPAFKNFVHAVADETFTIDRHSQIEQFVDAVFDEFNSYYKTEKIIGLFVTCNGTASEYAIKKSTQEPISYLEMKIDATKSKRNENRIKAYEYGLRLHADCKQELSSLRSILGVQDLKYKMIADKLAKEIMQCGIDYFDVWMNDMDVSEQSLELLKYGQSIAVGSPTQERIRDQVEAIQEWAKNAPIQKDLTFIISKIKGSKYKTDSFFNAEDIITSCQPRLESMKHTLGVGDELYINACNMVVVVVQQMLVTVLNDAQEHLDSHSQINELKEKVRKTLLVFDKLGVLSMSDELRQQYLKNRKTILSIDDQLGARTANLTEQHSPLPKSFNYLLIAFVVAGGVIGLINNGPEGLFTGTVIGILIVGIVSWIVKTSESG